MERVKISTSALKSPSYAPPDRKAATVPRA